jgi:dethiobiotin synthetase
MPRGIFVTGTDTNVGKTVVSAAVMIRYRDEAPLTYWKPVQTGVEHDDDSREVARLAGVAGREAIHNRGVRLAHPVSPHLAAQLAGTRITVRSLVDQLNGDADGDARWVVEGAGGVLVPINERETMADLISALDLPVLIAARSTLGTINHTLMTIEVLRRRMLRVAGVVMVGEPNAENRLAIEQYGAAEVMAEMPRFDPLTPDALEAWARTSFDPDGILFVGCLR